MIRRKYLFSILALSVALGGCVVRGGPRQNVLRYPLGAELSSFDPVTITDPTTIEPLSNVYEGLVQYDEHNQLVPCLAERWEVSADGKTYTFRLRPNVKFHNGRVMTADDVKWSFERALWPETKSPVAADYMDGILGVADVVSGRRRDLAGVKVVDPHTLVISLDKPRAFFLGELAYNTGWVFCREAIEKSGGRLDERSTIGTGPFKLGEYRPNAKLTLVANPDYWGGRPKLDRIERPVVIDAQTAHTKFAAGELDIAGIALSDYVADMKDPKLKPDLQLQPEAQVGYLAMGETNFPPFRKVKVRQAFARAIDRDAIIRVAYFGLYQRADAVLPPGMPGADPDFPHIPYDPAGARELLAEAGYPSGKGFPRLTLVYLQNDPQYSAVAPIIRDYLQKNLGITVDLEQRESATFFADARAKKLTFHLNGWLADYPDPHDFLPMLLHTGSATNRWSYSNPTFDKLCDEADAEQDPNKRMALYRQADRLAMSEVALLPLVYAKRPVLVKPYVHDFKTNLMGYLPQRTTYVERGTK